MSAPTLAFLDIETTGLNPYEHEVLEVAYILEWPNGSIATTHFSLPISERNADQRALDVNGYWRRRDELMAIELAPKAAAAKLQRELGDCLIVGANPAFDTAFLRQFIWQTEYAEPTWYYRSLDINTLAAGVAKFSLPLSTGEVAELFNEPLGEKQHTALEDACWNRRAYKAITKGNLPRD